MNDEADYLSGLAANPAFGSGSFLRVWTMRRLAPDRLRVAMEDSFHALHMTIRHDDETVLDVGARWVRYPLSSCGGAANHLAAMAGSPVTPDLLAVGSGADIAAHCTHMFDSFRLGVTHIASARPDRRYDIILPDMVSGAQSARLLVDEVERLTVEIAPDMRLLSPPELAGAPLMRGLARWARDRIDAERFEWLFMLQRSIFVSWGRKVDMDRYKGRPATIAGPPEGSCYASQPERYADAIRRDDDRPDIDRDNAVRF